MTPRPPLQKQNTTGALPFQNQFELFFSCESLAKLDTFSKSDPQVRLYAIKNVSGPAGGPAKTIQALISQTEMVKDTSNPKFGTSIVVNYHFEEQQLMRVEVIDVDKTNAAGEVRGSDRRRQNQCSGGGKGKWSTKPVHQRGR